MASSTRLPRLDANRDSRDRPNATSAVRPRVKPFPHDGFLTRGPFHDLLTAPSLRTPSQECTLDPLVLMSVFDAAAAGRRRPRRRARLRGVIGGPRMASAAASVLHPMRNVDGSTGESDDRALTGDRQSPGFRPAPVLHCSQPALADGRRCGAAADGSRPFRRDQRGPGSRATGDRVLVAFARLDPRRICRPRASSAGSKPDTFVAVLPAAGFGSGPHAVAGEIRMLFAHHVDRRPQGGPLRATVSIGIANSLAEASPDLETLRERADLCLDRRQSRRSQSRRSANHGPDEGNAAISAAPGRS